MSPGASFFNPFPTFAFTGALRPVYPPTPRREVPKSITAPNYAYTSDGNARYRFINRNDITILNPVEQEAMRKVCRLSREVLDIAAAAIKPGFTTDYIDEVVHKASLERGVRTSLFPTPCD